MRSRAKGEAKGQVVMSRAEWLRTATPEQLDERRLQLQGRYRDLRSRPRLSREEAHGRVDALRSRAERELRQLLDDTVTVALTRADPPVQAGIADRWVVARDDTLAQALHDRIDGIGLTPADAATPGCLTHETREERVGEQQALLDQVQAINDELDRRTLEREKAELAQRERSLLQRITGQQGGAK